MVEDQGFVISAKEGSMEPRMPTQLAALMVIVFSLALFSCNAEEDKGVPARGKITEAPDSAFIDLSNPTPRKDNHTIDADTASDAYYVVFKDKFGFVFRLNILNRSGKYDIYEGESIDPRGNRYAAGGIYNKIDGELSISSFIQGNVPYYSNLRKASGTEYRGYEQLLGDPWEHYQNAYQIIEGRLE